MVTFQGASLIGDTLMKYPYLASKAPCEYVTDDAATRIVVGHMPGVILTEDKTGVELDCNEAMRLAVAHRTSMTDGYFLAQGESPTSDSHYVYDPVESEKADARELFKASTSKVVLCARHSRSCTSNDPRFKGAANKCFSPLVWKEFGVWLVTQGYIPVAIGSKAEANDKRFAPWVGPKLYGKPLETIAALTSMVAATFSVDTGIRHLSAATGGNTACVSCALPLWLISCRPRPDKPAQRVSELFVQGPSNVTVDVLKRLAEKVLSF